MNAIATTQPQRHAPRALWLVAQAFLNTLYTLFGAPEDVAAKHTMLRDAYERLASWLACGEAYLRRLLLIEAAAYFKIDTPPPRQVKRTRERRRMSFSAEQPEEWRVSFRCFPGARDCGGPRATPSIVELKTTPADPRFCSAWPLAERYEAMIRVFNDPKRYAQRLAQRLYERPHRVQAVLRAPEEAAHRIDCFDEAGAQGERAWPMYREHRSSG